MNVLLAMIPAFFWGTTYAVTQFTLPDWPPLLLGVLRALPAGLILLALKPCLPERQDWGVLIKLSAVNIAIFFCLIFVMALTLPSAISGVGMVSVPVFAMLFHWTMSKQRPTKIQAICSTILILLAWQLFNPKTISLSPLGLSAMLAAIICIIVGSTITKTLGGRIHWWTVLTWQLIIGGVLLIPIALVHAFWQPTGYIEAISHLNLNNSLGLAWLILLNTVFGYGMYVWLLQRMSVVDFTFGGIANPIAGIVSGMVLLNEVFSPYQYLLMMGMIITSLMPPIIERMKQKWRT